jgi:hypothetical protein
MKTLRLLPVLLAVILPMLLFSAPQEAEAATAWGYCQASYARPSGVIVISNAPRPNVYCITEFSGTPGDKIHFVSHDWSAVCVRVFFQSCSQINGLLDLQVASDVGYTDYFLNYVGWNYCAQGLRMLNILTWGYSYSDPWGNPAGYAGVIRSTGMIGLSPGCPPIR